MDGGAWWAAVHGVAKSWTRISEFTFTFHFHALEKEMATHSSVLAWRIPGMGEPGRSMGLHRVRHDWSDLAAAAAISLGFWIVVLEKTLESPLDCKEIQPVHSKGGQSWVFFGRNDAKAETPVLWPPHAKSWLIGKDSDAGRDWGRKRRGRQRMRWLDGYHWLNGREFGWTPGVCDGQGGLACCNSWSCKESDTTEWLNWTKSPLGMYYTLQFLGLYYHEGKH